MKTTSPLRFLIIVLSLLAIALSWWRVGSANAGLVTRRWVQDGVPLTYVAPAGAQNMPGVVIAHGFSGSSQLMQGYSLGLARAGYATISVDFAGHGANPRPLSLAAPSTPNQRDGSALQADLDVAYAALLAQEGVDGSRVAILGHSMGSGAAMTAGIDQPERYAAVLAISPTGANVTADLPRNLHLQAGQLEPQFAANAERLLAEAGGSHPPTAEGGGREFQLIPSVEHISILFSPTSHGAARAWLDATLGHTSAEAYEDRRIVWYGMHLAAVVALAIACAPLLPIAPAAEFAHRAPVWGLVMGPFLATAALFLIGQFVELSTLGGMLVGGALALWFALFGLAWLAIGFRPPAPQWADLGWGLALFGLLTLAFGVLAQVVWLPWWMIGARLGRWLFIALACVPWQLAAGLAGGRRWLWWLGQSGLIGAGLVAAVVVVPSLGFVVLLVPLIPLLVGLMSLLGGVVQRPWAMAIGNAAFFGWVLAVVFPLAG
ncbi:MAG: alpha/beta fold hydrolase [Chloroflexi bacterium]|nr:alpha/beta fold hydrolase [Chloroflexota bacterium]